MPLSGGEVTGTTTFDEYTIQKKTQCAHGANAGGGSNGYIKFATVTYTHGANLDWLIEFEFIQRGFAEKATLGLLINSSNYDVKSFILNGMSQNCYYVITTTGTKSVIDLYIYKSGAWDYILFTSVKDLARNPAVLYSVEWQNEFISSLPSGYVTATRGKGVTFLANTTQQTATTYTVESLSSFDLLLLTVGYIGVQSRGISIIPTTGLKSGIYMNAQYYNESLGEHVNADCTYISDTSVSMKTTHVNQYGTLYGIRL